MKPADPRRWFVLSVSSLAVFMFFLDATIVNISFPALRAAFPDISASALSWVLNGYAIGFAAFLVAAGRIADLVGRRRVFTTGLVMFTVASALCGFAPSVAWLVAGRVLQSIGGALLVPSALGLVLPEFDAEERGTAVGLWSAVAAVAAAVGPTLGATLVEAAGWRWIFFINLPIGVATLWFGRKVLRESSDPSARAPDLPGAIALGAAMASLALAIVQGSEWGWADGRTLLAMAIPAVLTPGVLIRSARHPSPIIDVALFRERSFASANLASLLFGVGFYASMLNGVLFLTGVWGYSLIGAGLAITPGPLTAALAAGVGGKVADRRGYRGVIVLGCLLSAASGVYLFATAGPEASYLAVWLPASLLMGAGIGLGYATMGGAAVASLPPSRFAIGSAILSTSRQFGGAIGVAALITVQGTPTPATVMAAFDRSFLLVAAAIFAAGLAAMGLGRPARRVVRLDAAPVGMPVTDPTGSPIQT